MNGGRWSQTIDIVPMMIYSRRVLLTTLALILLTACAKTGKNILSKPAATAIVPAQTPMIYQTADSTADVVAPYYSQTVKPAAQNTVPAAQTAPLITPSVPRVPAVPAPSAR